MTENNQDNEKCKCSFLHHTTGLKLKSKLIFTSFIIVFFVIMNTIVFYMQSCFILPLERINLQITDFSESNTIVELLDFI
ncbi:MAG: hypothetical protein K6C94_06370, partial [Candidatus Gastranaerophilales bacterium]|nr:hypothetical protein [Candidatus Gastranaerophilales bacterium]